MDISEPESGIGHLGLHAHNSLISIGQETDVEGRAIRADRLAHGGRGAGVDPSALTAKGRSSATLVAHSRDDAGNEGAIDVIGGGSGNLVGTALTGLSTVQSHGRGSFARDSKVGGIGGGPADAALTALPTDANVLVLVSQVLTTGKVVGLDGVGGAAEKVLRAAVRSQVGVVARVLSHLFYNIH